MSDREKLVELINEGRRMCEDSDCEDCTHNEDIFCTRSIIADHLISNGVTLQKWIPVSERLPDVAVVKKNRNGSHTESVRVLCVCKQESGKRMIKEGFCNVYANGYVRWKIPGTVDSVTHWMPLPEPPKECG